MNCSNFKRYLGAFADGELETDSNAEALEHLNSCEACAGKVAQIRKLKEALARGFDQQQIPQGLADRVRAGIRREADQPAGGVGRLHKWVVPLGMAAAIVFVWQASLWFDAPGLETGGLGSDVEARFVSDARTRHRDCTRLGVEHHRPGLALNPETLRRVFSKELGLRVLAPDLSSFGYRLQSADTCGMGKSPGAHVVYEHETGGDIISVFTLERREGFMPTEGLVIGGRPCFVSRGPGPTLVAWHHGQATYVLCSTAGFQVLRAMVESIR